MRGLAGIGFRMLPFIIMTMMIGQCQKKECGGPCEMLRQCARTRMNLPEKDLTALRSACERSCPRYYGAVMECYRKAQKQKDGCMSYYLCAVSKYKTGAY